MCESSSFLCVSQTLPVISLILFGDAGWSGEIFLRVGLGIQSEVFKDGVPVLANGMVNKR